MEKLGGPVLEKQALTERNNLAFLGTSVVSGSGQAIVLAVGSETTLGSMAKTLDQRPPKTAFEKGVNEVSWVLIRFMLLMAPVVLLLNGFTKGDWTQACSLLSRSPWA